MLSAGFEPTITALERPQTYALERAAAGIDNIKMYLKKFYGPIFENYYWRILKNKKIRSKYKSPFILIIIKVCRPEWLGIVVRNEVT